MSPLAALVIDWVLTALWPIIGKSGTELYSTPLFLEAGLAIGCAALTPWLLRRGHWRRMFSAELGWTLFMMGLLSGVASLVYVSALEYTTPANAAIMAQVEVLYSALLCAWLLREPVPPLQVGASLLVVAGTGLIMVHDFNSPRWKGDLMILATPWMFQVSHIFAKRLPRGLDPIMVSGARIFYGILVLLPFCAWSLLHEPRWDTSPGGLSLLLAQGVLMSCLNLVFWYMAILHMDLAKATAFLLSYPALTMIFSWALGRETVSGLQVAGLAVTLSGAFWLSRLVIEAERKGRAQAPMAPGITSGDLIK